MVSVSRESLSRDARSGPGPGQDHLHRGLAVRPPSPPQSLCQAFPDFLLQEDQTQTSVPQMHQRRESPSPGEHI